VKKTPKQEYTAEFKEQGVKLTQEVNPAPAAREPGLIRADAAQPGHKAAQAGELDAIGARPVTAEQMELSRLRVENARLKMHVDISKATFAARPRPYGQKHAVPALRLAPESGRQLLGGIESSSKVVPAVLRLAAVLEERDIVGGDVDAQDAGELARTAAARRVERHQLALGVPQVLPACAGHAGAAGGHNIAGFASRQSTFSYTSTNAEPSHA
jgi:transposase